MDVDVDGDGDNDGDDDEDDLHFILQWPSPRCVNKYSIHFCNFKFPFYSLEITSLISIFIALHVLGILVKQA
jgi:hypothetical protein